MAKLVLVQDKETQPTLYLRAYIDGDGDLMIEAGKDADFKASTAVGYFSIDSLTGKLRFYKAYVQDTFRDIVDSNGNGTINVT
jgi:hypothetical protein